MSVMFLSFLIVLFLRSSVYLMFLKRVDSSLVVWQKKVLFVHRGVSFGRFVLFVSDGKHYVSTLLEVVITPSYFIM